MSNLVGVTIFIGEPTEEELNMFKGDACFCTKTGKDLFSVLRPYSLQMSNKLNVYKCASFDDTLPENLTIKEEVVKEVIKLREWAIMNVNGLKVHEKLSIKHMFKNLTFKPYLSSNLKDKFKNIPAIVVSAGPSLDKNIHLLKKQEKCLVIAVGQVLNKLNALGIDIDICVSIDPYSANVECFNDINKYPPLFFDNALSPEIVSNYKGDKYMSFNDSHFTKQFMGTKTVPIETGMSVAHYAFNFAEYLGCESVTFIGQDFAFENGKFHCDNYGFKSMNDNELKEHYDKKIKNNEYEVEGFWGGNVKTNQHMRNYLIMMQDYIKKSKVKVYNCTEGGAYIEGAKHMTLIDRLNNLNNIDIRKKCKEILQNNSKKLDATDLLKEILTKLTMFSNFSKELNKIIEVLRKAYNCFLDNHFDDGMNIMLKAKNAEAVLKNNSMAMNMVTHLCLDVLSKQMLDPAQVKNAFKEKNINKILDYIKFEVNMYESIFNAVDFVKKGYKDLFKEFDKEK